MLCQQFVAEAVWVDPINSKRLLVFGVEHFRSVEKVNIGNLADGSSSFGGSGILHKAGVIHLAIGQVWSIQIFMGNRGAEDNTRSSLAAVVLFLGIINPLHQFLCEGGRVAVVGLVVAPEGNNDVGLGNFQVIMRGDEATIARSTIDLIS